MTTDRFIEDLKSRIDLVDIVKRYTEVKKSGKNYMARSPFRNERTPSFSISPEKQMWYDFGSSEGGDTISFVEKIENVTFQEAIEFLADIAGVEIPKTFNEKKGPSKDTKKDIYKLHDDAASYFQDQLKKNKTALKYLHDRNISDEVIKDWRLGYGGDKKDGLTRYLLGKGYREDLIAQSGVAFERSFGDKAMMDRFWGRVMIPISEPRAGEIIAFSGRDILDREKVGKYVNSPENPVYHKSSTLFGLDRARKVIKDTDKAVLVEGNFDVIMAHAAGLTNVIATCGTALTEDHLRLLRRFTKNFYLSFDNDNAGKKATLKSTEMCLRMELNPFVVFLPDVKDFGEFLETPANAQKLPEIIKTAPTALDFFFTGFSEKLLDDTLAGEKKFLDNFFYYLKLVTRPIEVDEYLTRLAELLKRNKPVLEAEFLKFSHTQTDYQKPKYVEETKVKFSLEESLVGMVIAYWDHFARTLKARGDDIINLLIEPDPKNILAKKINKTALTEPEQKQMLAWELWQENLWGDMPNTDSLTEEFERITARLQREHEKKARTQAMKDLKL